MKLTWLRVRSLAISLLLLGLLTACDTARQQQSILNPEGPRAESVHGLWLLMLILGSIIWILVTVVTIVAVVRRRRSRENVDQTTEGEDSYGTAGEGPSRAHSRGNKARTLWIVAFAGAIVPAVVILIVTAASTIVLRDINPNEAGDGTVVEVTGHQYWWEVRYPELDVVTANEIHIPVGERVELQVNSSDVIHSFWVPELSGKMDMIPGRSNSIWLEADKPGIYWGQCSEYCGEQHAKMRFVVVAHELEEFSGWVSAQQEPAEPPTLPTAESDEPPLVEESEALARGREVFMSSSCVYCHAINGTAATGEVGPDLTHLASRETLAAGVLPNDRGNLAGWILNPQSIKPGALMPGTDLDGDDLRALLTYLESLE